MNMTDDIRREIVKALAYGKKTVEIRDVMCVSTAEIKSIGKEEIAAKRAELQRKGYVE